MIFRNITEAYPAIISDIINNGQKVNSRGMDCIEKTNYSFVITDVSQPLAAQKKRRLNVAYAVLEPFLLTMPQTYSVVDACNFYVGKFLRANVVDPKTEKMFGWYGDRLNHNGRNQLLDAFEVLKTDPGSRRAVITIHNSQDELFRSASKDTPCTLEIQFLVRGDRLDCYVNMRGNDVMLGTPQNVAMWTFFQRMMAKWLGIQAGVYYHRVNSMHLYVRDIAKAKEVIQSAKELREDVLGLKHEWEMPDPVESLRMCELFAKEEMIYREMGVRTKNLTGGLEELFTGVIAPAIDSKKHQNPYANAEG